MFFSLNEQELDGNVAVGKRLRTEEEPSPGEKRPREEEEVEVGEEEVDTPAEVVAPETVAPHKLVRNLRQPDTPTKPASSPAKLHQVLKLQIFLTFIYNFKLFSHRVLPSQRPLGNLAHQLSQPPLQPSCTRFRNYKFF